MVVAGKIGVIAVAPLCKCLVIPLHNVTCERNKRSANFVLSATCFGLNF